MPVKATRVDYFHATAHDRPGEAYRLLEELASHGVSLLAFNAIPVGHERTQLVLFPEDAGLLARVAQQAGIVLIGPQQAILVRGVDEMGALAHVHEALADDGINVYSSSGITDGRGGFSYLIHVRPEQFTQAIKVLGA
jgi:hypothetical protein